MAPPSSAGKGRRWAGCNSQDQNRARVPSTALTAANAAAAAPFAQPQPEATAADGNGREHGAAPEETYGPQEFVGSLGPGRRQDKAGAARQTFPGTATPAAQGQEKEFQGHTDTSVNR